MDFNYLGYAEDKKIVKGTISASNEKIAGQILAQSWLPSGNVALTTINDKI